MSPLLEVAGLVVRYRFAGGLFGTSIGTGPGASGWIEAVAGASLELFEGRTLALVGESGSGKTTLGRAIMGLLPASAGTIRFEGRDFRDLTGEALRRQRRRIAMVFQDPIASLSPRLTVGTLITEPLTVDAVARAERAQAARRLIRMVGLSEELLERYPHQLSGGQARRIGIARALCLDPRLIIADEPTAGLDVSVQGDVLNLLRRLQQERGISYLIITHNLPIVRRISADVAIMYLGRIVESGPTAEVFPHPFHPYTRGLLDSVPGYRRRRAEGIPGLSGEAPSLIHRPPGCEFHGRCPRMQPACRAARPELLAASPGHEVRCFFPLAAPADAMT
jgi:oligopeptide/dipeptide ABC transporter ATP-binding protein